MPIVGKGRGNGCAWNGQRRMREGILKPDIVSDFKFRSKCMFGAELRKESIERV